MDYHPIDRRPTEYQRSVTAEQIQLLASRTFGTGTQVLSATELGLGAYNNTYRVELHTGPVILRVAPEPGRQFRIERELMRNEHASVPYLAPLGSLLPATLGIDFTHQVIGRDYLFQTVLPGVPAPDGLAKYPRPEWSVFFEQLGTITRALQSVAGSRFGPVAGPGFATWSEAVADSLANGVADLTEAGLDATDVTELLALVRAESELFDEITEPRLLHGDLWTVNVLVDPDADTPTVTGVCDCDRTSWGDPLADWAIMRALDRPGTERDGFWRTYGPPPTTPEATRRHLCYRAWHLVGGRLERHRLGHADALAQSYGEFRSFLDRLAAG